MDSFIPFWAWDEPPAKKAKKSSKSKTSSKSKSTKSEKATAATTQPVGLGDAPSTAAHGDSEGKSADVAKHLGGDDNMRKRQQAYVEEVEE